MAGVKDKNCELVAKRWALALMELAQEDENISKEDILDDLREIASTIDSSEDLNMESSTAFITDVSSDTVQVSNSSAESFTEVISSITPTSENIYTTGGVHTHTATIVEGTIADSESTEQSQKWDNAPINIEPEYYALIFIIKL
jgi:hypothetical protein